VSGSPWGRLWARDGATVAGTQFGSIAVTTLLAVVVARHLGPSDFGVFAGFLGLSQVLMLVAGLGVPTWLLRELTAALADGDPAAVERTRRWMAAGIRLSAALTAAFTAAAVVVASLVSTGSDLVLALVGLMVYTGLLGVSAILEVHFRARRRLSRIVVATLVEKLSLVAMVVAAIAAGGELAGLAAAYACAGLLRIAIDLAGLRGDGLATFLVPRRGDWRLVVRGSVPFGLASALPTAVARLDVFVIGLLSATTAGLYAIADRFLGVLLIVPAAFAGALYPHLAGRADPLKESWRAAARLGAAGAALAAAGVALAGPAVELLFGEEYRGATGGVRIMLCAAPLMFASSVLMTGMFSGGSERRVLVVMVTCSLTGTGFIVAGRGLWGLEGATAGYVLRNLVMLAALAALSVALRCSAARPGAERPEPPPAAVELPLLEERAT
jgi:O-antigen/teichoic acid export membrane protein